MRNPLKGWQVDRTAIRTIGHGLQRPECILAERDGTLWSADARGGVMRIAADGGQRLIAQQVDTRFTSAGGTAASYILEGTLPNGLAFARNGDILIANFGTDAIEVMTRAGASRTLYREIDGVPLGKSNFILRDSQDRIWFTVTTRAQPWTRSINEKLPDGYLGLIDARGIRIVADGFVGTNECRLDASEEWLYVVESNARRISRLRVLPDGTLNGREIYGPSELQGIPDGCAFDRHFHAGTVTPEIMMTLGGTLAPWTASVTFGGADLCTVYVGSLRGTTIPYFRAPVPGLPMVHWNEQHA